MVELKINKGTDRENLVWALANNGYTVKVVEKPHPTKMYTTEYFVQILDVENDTQGANVTVNIESNELVGFGKKITEILKSRGIDVPRL